MDYRISLSRDRSHIKIKYFVPMTTELSLRSGPELMKLATENNIKQFLFDLTESSNTQSVADNYYFAYRDIEEFAFPRDTVSAFLVRPGDQTHDFITTAFLNAGYIVKIFHDEQKALAWLKSGGD